MVVARANVQVAIGGFIICVVHYRVNYVHAQLHYYCGNGAWQFSAAGFFV